MNRGLMLRVFASTMKPSCSRPFSVALEAVRESTQSGLNSELFDHLKHEVYGDAKKLEKVVVQVYKGAECNTSEEKPFSVLINKNVTSGYECLLHVSKKIADESVIVKILPEDLTTGAFFSSPNVPINGTCTLRAVNFDNPEPTFVDESNKAFWRSCRVFTGAVLRKSFNDKSIDVDLSTPCSWSDGFFAVHLRGLGKNPISAAELSTINGFARNYLKKDIKLECIYVPSMLAEANGLKHNILVRVDDFVCETDGAVVGSTRQIGDFSIVQAKTAGERTTIAGVALPVMQPTSSYSWELIVKSAARKFDLHS